MNSNKRFSATQGAVPKPIKVYNIDVGQLAPAEKRVRVNMRIEHLGFSLEQTDEDVTFREAFPSAIIPKLESGLTLQAHSVPGRDLHVYVHIAQMNLDFIVSLDTSATTLTLMSAINSKLPRNYHGRAVISHRGRILPLGSLLSATGLTNFCSVDVEIYPDNSCNMNNHCLAIEARKRDSLILSPGTVTPTVATYSMEKSVSLVKKNVKPCFSPDLETVPIWDLARDQLKVMGMGFGLDEFRQSLNPCRDIVQEAGEALPRNRGIVMQMMSSSSAFLSDCLNSPLLVDSSDYGQRRGGYGRGQGAGGSGGYGGRRHNDSSWGRQGDYEGGDRSRRRDDFGQGGRGGNAGGRGSDGDDSGTILVDSNDVGRIIGRGGQRIRGLEADSGCRIQVSRDRNANGRSSVELSGSKMAILKAKRLIRDAGVEFDSGKDRRRGW